MKSVRSVTIRAAYSITELVVTIAILGVLAAIAIPIYSNVRDDSERALADDHVEALNRAVTAFSQNCWKLPTVAQATSTTDEFAVVRSLQYRFPAASLKPGSPYFDPGYDPKASSNTAYLRIRWNGKSFERLDFGQAGTGLRFNSGSDYNRTPYAFPSNYKPDGAF